MTYDDFVAIALALPDTSEGMSYGTPSVKRKKRFMFRLKEDGESVALKLDWDSHNVFLESLPHQIYKTAHYEGYPAFLVRLDGLDVALADELIKASWEDAPKVAKSR